MHIVSLICAPGSDRLDKDLADSLRNAWGGGPVTWLSANEAAEFPIDHVPDNSDQVRLDLGARQVDLNLVPSEDRKKSILIADMDSTIIQQECIDELADEFGVGAQVAAVTSKAMNGEIDFELALRERVSALIGAQMAVIETVLRDRITLMPGARELVATMREHGAYTALVSGGFTVFTSRIARQLGFDENRANTLLTDNDRLTGEVAVPILGRDAKVQALREICAKLNSSAEAAVAVGDGANDLGMLDLAGMGVALHAKPVVAEQAEFVIRFGDLTALLFLQGYSRAEFST